MLYLRVMERGGEAENGLQMLQTRGEMRGWRSRDRSPHAE